MERYRHWLALKKVAGVGNVLFKRLVETFSSPNAVFQADEAMLTGVEGVSAAVARAIASFSAFSEIDAEFEKIEKAGATLLCSRDAGYPPLLSAIYDPPPLLYMKGTLNDPHAVAVVGSRKTTPYGRAVAEQMGRGLARQAVTVVSGFARGIDGVVHRATLAAGGRTLAVLGCGVDCVYPPEHQKLRDEVITCGAILSEFPMGTPPEAHHFPQRNRIISGLALGCVVIEATETSGALITARCALEQGREVFAVPGWVTSPTSAGPHRLIQNGAKLAACVADILVEILPHLAERAAQETPLAPPPPLEGNEAVVYAHLALVPKHIDQIIHESGQTAAAVAGFLLTLEIKGVVRTMPGQFYART